MRRLNDCCGQQPVFWIPIAEIEHLKIPCSIQCQLCLREVEDVSQSECVEKWNSIDSESRVVSLVKQQPLQVDVK